MRKNLPLSCMVVALGYLFFMWLTPNTQTIVDSVQAESIPEKQASVEEPEQKILTDYDVLVQEVQKYDWDVNTMLAIAKAESGYRKDAVGDQTLTYQNNGRTYGYSVGMFQIRILEGREDCDTFDIPTNVSCAYRIYKGQGLSAWSCFSNGSYRQFLQ